MNFFEGIIARQFHDLKFGDRFYYENGESKQTRFNREQLNEIRKASIAKIYCNNLGLEYIQKNAFYRKSDTNPIVDCSTIPDIDLSLWAKNSKLKIELLGVLNVYTADYLNNLTDKTRGPHIQDNKKKKEYYANPYNSMNYNDLN